MLQRSSIRFVLVLPCYLNLDHLLGCSRHLNMPTLQQLGKIVLLWSMARLNHIESNPVKSHNPYIKYPYNYIESNLGMEMCVWVDSAPIGVFWRVSVGAAIEISNLKPRFVLKFLEWMMQRCCRKPWNVWMALVLVQRNGVPSSNSSPRCLGTKQQHIVVATLQGVERFVVPSADRCCCWVTCPSRILGCGLTNRTAGKCVKMVWFVNVEDSLWAKYVHFQSCLFAPGGKRWQSDRRWRTC